MAGRMRSSACVHAAVRCSRLCWNSHKDRLLHHPFSTFPTLRNRRPNMNQTSSTFQDTSSSSMLGPPAWSVKSLFPDNESTGGTPTAAVSTTQVRHLLRLSALPVPDNASDLALARMAKILQSQLYFVREIQGVDTSGVEPLRSIRDETSAGLQEQTIGREKLREALSQEQSFGHCKRPRRHKDDTLVPTEDWDPLGNATQTAGRYFVVHSRK